MVDVLGSGGVRVVVYDSSIDRMWQPGGESVKFANEQAEIVKVRAKARAPSRTGRLRASIRERPSRSMGRRHVMSSVEAPMPYASYVHEGTTGLAGHIYPNVKDALVLPAYGRHPKRILLRVRTQRAQPFLRSALDDTVRPFTSSGRAIRARAGLR